MRWRTRTTAAIVVAVVTAMSGQLVDHATAQPAAAGAAQPRFSATVRRVTAKELGKSYHHGCPTPPVDLRAVTLSFWGFDRHAHRGTLIVNKAQVRAIETALKTLYEDKFPIRRMRPVAAYGGKDNRSMAADNTSAFNCRYALNNGPKTWSAHAYGDAIDVDPRENPYIFDGRVVPPSGKPYADRSHFHRGMIEAGSRAEDAFLDVGWFWGGRWSAPDYQHFSSTGG